MKKLVFPLLAAVFLLGLGACENCQKPGKPSEKLNNNDKVDKAEDTLKQNGNGVKKAKPENGERHERRW